MDIFNSRFEYFLKTAEEPSFYEAAFKIGITQPTLSSAIKKLEGELGVPLFERSVYGVQLTEVGRALYSELNKYHSELSQKIQAPVPPFYKEPAIYAVYKKGISKKTTEYLNQCVEQFKLATMAIAPL